MAWLPTWISITLSDEATLIFNPTTKTRKLISINFFVFHLIWFLLFLLSRNLGELMINGYFCFDFEWKNQERESILAIHRWHSEKSLFYRARFSFIPHLLWQFFFFYFRAHKIFEVICQRVYKWRRKKGEIN